VDRISSSFAARVSSHTIRLEVTGTRNASSGGALVWLDAFDVVP